MITGGKASIKTQPFSAFSLKVGVAIGYLCSLGNIDPFSFIYESRGCWLGRLRATRHLLIFYENSSTSSKHRRCTNKLAAIFFFEWGIGFKETSAHEPKETAFVGPNVARMTESWMFQHFSSSHHRRWQCEHTLNTCTIRRGGSEGRVMCWEWGVHRKVIYIRSRFHTFKFCLFALLFVCLSAEEHKQKKKGPSQPVHHTKLHFTPGYWFFYFIFFCFVCLFPVWVSALDNLHDFYWEARQHSGNREIIAGTLWLEKINHGFRFKHKLK